MLFGTQLTRRDVMKAAWRIRREDLLAMGHALRRAWAWARRKGAALLQRLADPYAVARARGIFSPRDRSPEAKAHFDALNGRFPGRGSGSMSTGR
jgi:hypothetical protein